MIGFLASCDCEFSAYLGVVVSWYHCDAEVECCGYADTFHIKGSRTKVDWRVHSKHKRDSFGVACACDGIRYELLRCIHI